MGAAPLSTAMEATVPSRSSRRAKPPLIPGLDALQSAHEVAKLVDTVIRLGNLDAGIAVDVLLQLLFVHSGCSFR